MNQLQKTEVDGVAAEVEPCEFVRLDLPASYKHLNVVGACIAAVLERVDNLQERELLAYNIELAVHETCANIVEHAYAGDPGRIEVVMALREEPRRLEVDVRDAGQAFDWTKVRTPDLDEPQERGYGLFLVKELVDVVEYYPQPGANHWHLAKNL